MADLPQYLTRDQLLELLRDNGFPKSTLDKMCMPSRGEGPPWRHFGRGAEMIGRFIPDPKDWLGLRGDY